MTEKGLAISYFLTSYRQVAMAALFLLIFACSAYAAGLGTGNNQLWHQDTPFILEDAEVDDSFGYSVTTGDFNGDGFEDMAVGVPGESVGNIAGAGAGNIIYGKRGGLNST